MNVCQHFQKLTAAPHSPVHAHSHDGAGAVLPPLRHHDRRVHLPRRLRLQELQVPAQAQDRAEDRTERDQGRGEADWREEDWQEREGREVGWGLMFFWVY